jgi:membrane protein DedA with SNARE-associated domain
MSDMKETPKKKPTNRVLVTVSLLLFLPICFALLCLYIGWYFTGNNGNNVDRVFTMLLPFIIVIAVCGIAIAIARRFIKKKNK